MRVGDLLRAVLVDRVLVGGLEDLGEPERDLLLAVVALALDALAVETRALHAAADVAQQRLEAGRGEQVVVDVVVGGCLQSDVALGPGIPERIVEDDELEFRTRVGDEATVGEALTLRVEDAPGRLDHRAAAHVLEVRHDERRGGLPRDAAEGGHVGAQHEVAVALVPARHRVAVDRVHIDVDREQVVAHLGAVPCDLVEPEPARDALADEAPLGVGEGDDHRVDLVLRDRVGELVHRQISGHPSSFRRALVGSVTRTLHAKGRHGIPIDATLFRKA